MPAHQTLADDERILRPDREDQAETGDKSKDGGRHIGGKIRMECRTTRRLG